MGFNSGGLFDTNDPGSIPPSLTDVVVLAGSRSSGMRCATQPENMVKMGVNLGSQIMIVTNPEDIRTLYGTNAKLKLWRCVTFFNGKDAEERYRVERELERWVADEDDMGFLCN